MSDDRQKRIQQRAYEIWDREGRRSGMDAENWRRAEAEIAQEEEAGASKVERTEPSEPAPSAEPAATTERAPSAEPAPGAEPAAEPTEPALKPTKSRARTKPEAKPDETAAASQIRKPAGKDKAPEEETQEKGTRKRKTPAKKK